jgi:hypothetical protein
VKNTLHNTNREDRLNTIDAIREKKKAELLSLRNKYDKELQFRSMVKWFEYGERSNSFFLNLNKWWTKRKGITEIVCNGSIYKGNTEVTRGIREFYKDLY